MMRKLSVFLFVLPLTLVWGGTTAGADTVDTQATAQIKAAGVRAEVEGQLFVNLITNKLSVGANVSLG